MGKRARWMLALALFAVPAIVAVWIARATTVTQREKRMSRYDYLASNSAPAGCPMEITSGDFLFPGGGSIYIPPKELHAGWGNSVSVHVVGPDTKPLPDRMQITFYSYLEDKIYQGDFALPYGRIVQLFKDGYISYDPGTKRHITYREIVAGVAPGGAVAVWLSGIGQQVEVFFGYAEAVELDWHKTVGAPNHVDRERRRQNTFAEAGRSDPLVARSVAKVPLGVWETYRTRYSWRPVFEGMAPVKLIDPIRYLNGEREALAQKAFDDQVQRPIPNDLSFVVSKPGKDYSMNYVMTFDEEETLPVFQRLGRAGTPIDFVFRSWQEEGKTRFGVWLRNLDEEVWLSKTKHEYYRVDRPTAALDR